MLAETLEKQTFQTEVRAVGLPIAEQRAKKRHVYQQAMKYKPSICRGCTMTVFCGTCDHGKWLITD